MKKMLIGILLFSITSIARADGIADIIKSSLITHVSAVSQYSRGHDHAAAIDSIIRIGKWNGESIVNIQAGFNRDIEENDTTHIIYGAQLKLSPFINPKLNLPEGWVFLRNLEHGPAMHYDTRRHGWYGYYQVGWVFGANPGQ